jgi:hypothetical protein
MCVILTSILTQTMVSLGFFKLCKFQVFLPDEMAVEHRNTNENPMYISYMLCMCK